MGSATPTNPTFELVKEIGEDVWIAIQRGDTRGEQYLARPMNAYRGPRDRDSHGQFGEEGINIEAFQGLMYDGNQGDAVARLLNHENLVSIIGRIDVYPMSRTKEDDNKPENKKTYLVWDFCDASNLSTIFATYEADNAPDFYLPEDLCWHVLRSLLRAVAYLHDGMYVNRRMEVDPRNPLENVIWPEMDWAPILHRDIHATNIFFQHPRGTETYGKCKLGNFANAFVSSHHYPKVRHDRSETRRPGCAQNRHRGHESLLSVIVNKSTRPWDSFPEAERQYDLRRELWTIGSIVFTMMTGELPTLCCKYCGCSHIVWCRSKGCLSHNEQGDQGERCGCLIGGCNHVSPDECLDVDYGDWKPCPPQHHCEEPVININTYMSRARYSSLLRDLVTNLLKTDPKRQSNLEHMRTVWTAVEKAYRLWKDNFAGDYRDLEDDLWDR